MKRFLSISLCICLILSMVAVVMPAVALTGGDGTVQNKSATTPGDVTEEVVREVTAPKYLDAGTVSDFATNYIDSYGEITANAFILDLTNTTAVNGDTVQYSWEGTTYNFVWGTNAFNTADNALIYAASQSMTVVQMLIPENSIITENNKYFWIRNATVTNFTSIEVYGQNRTIDPNDKAGASVGLTLDWTLNSEWDKYSTNGGTSALGAIILNGLDEAGILKFKGITMRDTFYDRSRTAGSVADPRNLSITIENSIADYTALSKYNAFLFDLKSPRADYTGAAYGYNDTFTVKNFRVAHYFYKTSSYSRFVNTGNINNMTFDGFYFDESTNLFPTNNVRFSLGTFGYVASTSASSTTGSVTFRNCNLRNSSAMRLSINGYAANAVSKGVTETVIFDNNIVYNCSKAAMGVIFDPTYFTSLSICNNIFINSESTQPVIGTTTAVDTIDYVATIGYVATGNTFVTKNVNTTRYMKFGAGTTVDSTGSYIALYTDDYMTDDNGIPTNFGNADYFYLDYQRTMLSDTIYSYRFTDEVNYNLSTKTATVEVAPTVTTLNFTNYLVNEHYNSLKCYSDEERQLTQDATAITVPATGTTAYLEISSPDGSAVPDVITINIVKTSAYLVSNSQAGKSVAETGFNWVSWRGIVTATGNYVVTNPTFGSTNQRFGVIYVSDGGVVDTIKQTLSDGVDDVDAAVASINAAATNTYGKAYVMPVTRTLSWDDDLQGMSYRYNFKIAEGKKRATVMYVVYEDESGAKQISFSELNIQTSAIE